MLALSNIVLILEVVFFAMCSFGTINQSIVGFVLVALIICTIISAELFKKGINGIKQRFSRDKAIATTSASGTASFHSRFITEAIAFD